MLVLAAEDDAISRLLLVNILRECGHEAVEAADGLQAWDLLRQPGAPKVAILDWMMPGMDGLEVCRRIRGLPDTYIYTIMHTARDDDLEIDEGFQAGADDYLVKPVSRHQLVHRLHVAERILSYEERLQDNRRQLLRYANEMQSLAEERARQLVHADRMVTLGTLSAGIAHEINNPVSFISGNMQTMQRAWTLLSERLKPDAAVLEHEPQLAFLFEEFPKMFAGMKNGVERVTKIVSGLKRFARVDSGTREKFQVGTVIAEALELCQGSVKHRAVVETSIPEGIPDILGDARQIEQVVVNLVTNAVDAACGRAEARVSVRVHFSDGVVCTEIADNGPGIPLEVMDRLFDPFFTTKEEGKGTGLGLSISKGIMDEHGGTLTVRNDPAGGARFVFCLPVAGRPTQEDTPQ